MRGRKIVKYPLRANLTSHFENLWNIVQTKAIFQFTIIQLGYDTTLLGLGVVSRLWMFDTDEVRCFRYMQVLLSNRVFVCSFVILLLL